MRFLIILSLAFGLTATQAEDSPKLLPGAHAHNDYKHAKPLEDALSHGFQSVEADIFLIDDQLLVAHDRHEVKPERTLQALYLDPLKERANKHNGHIYAKSKEPFYLLIDFKSKSEPTYKALHQVLTQYQDMLTEFKDSQTNRKAVTVIVSGNRPAELLASLKPRLAGRDGRLSDLETADPQFTPWISDNWNNHFKWRGTGEIPKAECDKLEAIVKRAHERKLQVRFWAIPDNAESWGLMRLSHVDFINTDKLGQLSTFLSHPSKH
ncbi:MAG: hypothetical protein GWQ05_19280 [Verrucomicrobiaceae bacterium]|nr:hypothetical protein [Verrucomicrobiaceae bacterium]